MNDKTKAETPAKKESKEAKVDESRLIDPKATAPSNDPLRDERTATATEPNSKQRVAARKASRTGRGNGGGDADAAKAGLRAGLNTDPTPDTLGEREGVSPADTDLIWTNASKDKWGVDQPPLSALLKQRDHVAAERAKEDDK